ncbi:MAG: 30S ribosomal protein S3 [Candidatus Moranbacteria bacterium RIFOXYA12_FULL_35_19]|nr:MAG: 30S ribosomal protein S3 [Candidatus Moranbacteria bacterium GW2011_GWF2_35_39]OGI31644.1 MAG: 30S ribosomal protein S3 [Candidatus Moranbacteria bacterium RIFOXYB12_FULL_35_8]OGI32812.1 MAG: 30S ribosomal protein S3 [Candidatus Moranbacteria bacterium RIFOXYC12_FULL_36_13]OGI36140.1 MAG: 30S ribosomal protein S3 [Candidatus Moranbacteria bacterium RIFOXYA12_FULL_35_19]
MGHKINPIGFRMGITQDWKSKWFSKKEYKGNLKQDIEIRSGVSKKWKAAFISEVEIERSAKMIRVIIKTARPGVLIGRGGSGIEDIKNYIQKEFFKNNKKMNLKVDILEVKNMEESAAIMAQNIADQLEKRLPFRKSMKSALEQIMKNKSIKGVKIEMSGRLGGAEMSRREWAAKGTLPLHTMRADIDFARATAYTTYGTLGVKVWLYKGEVFER